MKPMLWRVFCPLASMGNTSAIIPGHYLAVNPEEREQLRAEIEVLVARDLFGIRRDEMCYILDPATIYGEECPIETFRVLKNNEIREFGEYRTQRLVLDTWDQLAL